MVKNPPANAGDLGSIPGWEDPLEKENGNPLQYSCLGNLIDRGAWEATVHGVTRVGHDQETKPPPPLATESFQAYKGKIEDRRRWGNR